VLLSFADNNQVLAQYAERHPKFPVVLVQNAIRDTVGSISNRYSLPIYLSFGEVERSIFKDLQITSRRYLPIGSIKLALALDAIDDPENHDNSVSFISHFRPSLVYKDCSVLEKLINQNQELLLKSTGNFVKRKSLQLNIILKSRNEHDQQIECAYFKSVMPEVSFFFITSDKGSQELNSYIAGLRSRLIVHPGSTLGFELLGAGKKVLCGATINKDFVQTWGISRYIDTLPTCSKLPPSNDWNDFYKHANRLWKMSANEYSEEIKQARHNLMNMPGATRAHEKLKNILSDLI
jgi:surface carbohydrate biosynthesis protein